MHPALHGDTVGLEVAVDLLKLLLLAVVHEVRKALLGVGGEPLVALFLGELRCDLLYIIGIVAVLGQGYSLPKYSK